MSPSVQTQTKRRYEVVTEEKSGGATYTPRALADFVATKIVGNANLGELAEVRVLDPAIGDGELVLSLLDKLAPQCQKPIVVCGFDTDLNALREARRRIATTFPKVELCLEEGSFLDFVLARCAPAPSLFDPLEKAEFDLVIANPPYVRTQIIGADQAQALASLFGLSGRVDLYHAFLMGIARVLRPGGTAGIIVSNRFMTTKGGASVRASLRRDMALQHVWDFGDTKLFSAAVLPAVVLAHGQNGQANSAPVFTSIYQTKLPSIAAATDPIEAAGMSGIVALDDGRRFEVQQGVLDTSGDAHDVWRIATQTGDEWLATVARHAWGTFRDIGKVRVGVKTCADKVFIRTDWADFAESDRPELLRHLITHHTAGRFRARVGKQIRAILYPHEVTQGQRRAVDLAPYPKSLAYLEQHRSTLEARTYLMDAGRRWYELWVPQDPGAWSAPKLVFRDISERPTFWVDLEGGVVNGDCYWLATERGSSEEVLWLAAAVANSTFIEAFYDRRFNNKLYAGRRRFITQYVEMFPLPDPASEIARRLIASAKLIHFADDQALALNLERELDAMVWEAFGLAVEEVVG
jgi:SAM-dependent methyltransferase